MYLFHYKLSKKPFDISPNPEFLWLGDKHREGLAVLKYGILENKGFLMITGEIGTGKTALIRAIHQEVRAKIIVVSIPDPGLSLIDFYNILASELKISKSFDKKGEFLIYFKRFILNAASDHRRLLLIIDEAQRLTSALLEEIRLLSNIDLDGKVVINTFFVGQSEFKALLQKPENQAVRQRITVNYELAPLTEPEVRPYVEHRLKVAGAKKEIFSEAALKLIHAYSKGYPRLVNIICDHALISGYVRGVDRIDEGIIKECCDELRIAIGTSPSKKPVQAASPPKPAAPIPEPVAEATPGRGFSWRRIAIFAGLLILLVGGYFYAGDRISNELARWGGSREFASIQGVQSQSQPPQSEQPKAISPKASQDAVTPEASKQDRMAPAAKTAPKPQTKYKEAKSDQKGSTSEASEETSDITLVPAQLTRPSAPSTPAGGAPPLASTPALSPQAPPAMQSDIGQIPATVEAFRLKEFVIFFSKNSSEIPIYAQDTVAGIASLMKSLPDTWLSIEGHTDSAGDPGLNKIISAARATAVKDYLAGEGIDSKRLKAIGYGPEKPLENNSTPEGRTKNRRVVMRIMVDGAP